MAAEARSELPFSHPVPKSLGAVSVSLWSPMRGWPSPLPPLTAYRKVVSDRDGKDSKFQTDPLPTARSAVATVLYGPIIGPMRCRLPALQRSTFGGASTLPFIAAATADVSLGGCHAVTTPSVR